MITNMIVIHFNSDTEMHLNHAQYYNFTNITKKSIHHVSIRKGSEYLLVSILKKANFFAN